MDMRIPPDVEVKARLLQTHEFSIGQKKEERSSSFADNSVKLRVVVMWIEQFGIMHMVWTVDNSHPLNLKAFQEKMPEKKLGFAEDINEAGRMAVAWISELVLAFDAELQKMEKCPIEFHPAWKNRDWPK